VSAQAKLRALVATVIIGMFAGASSAGAAVFRVDDRTDAPLSEPGDTTCASTDAGRCTLRAAVQAADNSGSSTTIELPAGEYDLTLIGGSGEDEPDNGDLDVQGSSVTITGARAATTIIDPGKLGRAFHVHEGASLTLTHTTVREGEAAEGLGGAFINEGALTVKHAVLDSNAAAVGGTVFMNNTASATSIINSTVEDSSAREGGVIFTEGGEVTLEGDTINNNKAAEFGGVLDGYEFNPGPVSVRRSTISHNESGTSGGALYLEAPEGHQGVGALTVSDSTLEEDSSGAEGGAVWGRADGPVTVTGSTLSKDTTAGPGGAIAEYETFSVSVASSTFDEDHGGEGGALYMGFATLFLSGSTFVADHGDNGGAIFMRVYGRPSLTTSAFTEDHASGAGGAIFVEGRPYGTVFVSASTFAGNRAGTYGGGMYLAGEERFALTNDTFEGNHAEIWAGALEVAPDRLEPDRTLLNDTIVRNSAAQGGGIVDPNRATVRNTIVAENDGGDCLGSVGGVDEGGNVDGDGSCFSSAVEDDHTDVAEPLVDPLAANGGPVETDALELGSPAIEGGVPGTCPEADARGISREGEPCDSGAYQGFSQAPTGSTTTTTSSSTGSTTATTSSATTTTTPSSGSTVTTSAASTALDALAVSGSAQAAGSRVPPCRSARVQAISWRVRPGSHLRGIHVTRGGSAYRTLSAAARRLTVSLVGMPRRTVPVTVIGTDRAGRRYTKSFTFHTCARAGARGRAPSGVPYLTLKRTGSPSPAGDGRR
jgi:hypothetical protein